MSLLVPILCTQVPAFVLQTVITLDLRVPWNVAACAGILFVCWTCIQFAQATKTNIILMDISTGVAITGFAMDAIHYTLLVHPLHVFRHLKQTQSAHELPWPEKFKWASQLCRSPRGIGWNFRVKNLPEHSTTSRKEFVLSHLMTAATHYIWMDIAQFYIRHDPGFQSSAAFASQIFVRRVLACGAYLVFQHCLGITIHSLVVALVVSCTSSEPSSWPDVYGKWKDAYTIRRFWGRTWHQMLRRFLVPFGKKMTSFLGFQPGTNGSSYTQLYTAFFVSAITHSGADIVIAPSRAGFSFPFFIYQALGITFEDMVIAAASRAGVKETKWTHLIGYAWVTSWFVVTATSWATMININGIGNGGRVIPSEYFPPSLCNVLVNHLGI